MGGFTHEISADEYLRLAEAMDATREFALASVDLFRDFDTVDVQTEGDLLAMVAPDAYPVCTSDTLRFVRAGYDFSAQDVEEEIEEYPVGHSAAFLARARRTGHPYMTAALARVNASWDALSKDARYAAAKAGLRPPEYNPFANNIAQAVELVDVLDRCSALCRRLAADEFEGSSEPAPFEVRAGRGVGFTEAPRGALFHILDINGEGRIERASIMTPTAQNIANLEADMRQLAGKMVAGGYDADLITLEVEKLVRAYDPCLSCSVH